MQVAKTWYAKREDDGTPRMDSSSDSLNMSEAVTLLNINCKAGYRIPCAQMSRTVFSPLNEVKIQKPTVNFEMF